MEHLVTCSKKGNTPRRSGRLTVGRNVTLTSTSTNEEILHRHGRGRQEYRSVRRAPYMKIKKGIVTQINVTSGHLLQKGHGTKTNWPTDRRS
jgi:hypothetical protein